MRRLFLLGSIFSSGLCLALVLVHLHDPSPVLAALDIGVLTLTPSVNPVTILPGGLVTVTVTLTNSGTSSSHIRITDTLPSGFSYVAGTTTLAVDGVSAAYYEPVISGASVSWGMTPFPGARSGNIYGVHTFVQDACDIPHINQQLDWALALAGKGGSVKQLLYHINNSTTGPAQCWIDFVNGAYDRGLTPILRLEGDLGGPNWTKPQADGPGTFTTAAAAFKSVVAGLPRRDGSTLYIEIWNEENLNAEWSGACNPIEYAQFFKQTADAIHSLGDTRIQVMNGGLSPGGDCNYLSFIDQMATVTGALGAIDVWATHPYPGNHPPQYNLHNGTASWTTNTIDTYRLELAHLQTNGRWGLRVLATEGGHDLGNNAFGWEGFAPIDETNRADYISRAYSQYWAAWPEVVGSAPFELSDPHGNWPTFDWIYPNGSHHPEYDSVIALPKPPLPARSQLFFQFQVRAPQTAGIFTSSFIARSSDGSSISLASAATVTVLAPPPAITMHTLHLPALAGGAGLRGPNLPLEPSRAHSPEAAGAFPRALALDTTRRILVWSEPGGLTFRGPDSLQRQARVEGEIRALAVDESRGTVWASEATSGRVLAFSMVDGRLLATVAGLAHPSGLAVNGGIIYVADTGSGELALIDSGTHQVTRRVGAGQGAYGVAYNRANGRVYVGLAGEDAVRVFNSNGEPVARIELGGLGLVQGLAVNPKTNRIYAVYFIGPRLHAIAEIDGATDQIVARFGGDYIFPLSESYGIAIDPARNRLYVKDRGGMVELDPVSGSLSRLGTAAAGYAFGSLYDPQIGQPRQGGTLAESFAP